MTVSELIKELEKFPNDCEVVIWDAFFGAFEPVETLEFRESGYKVFSENMVVLDAN